LIFFNSFSISEKSKKIFFNGFPISSMSFQFLQRLFNFFNGFPISSTAFQFSSMAFHFLRNPGKSIYGGKYTKDCYPSFVLSAEIAIFHDKIIGGKNMKDHYSSFVFSAPSFVILAN
jgi:hypothetical protein